MNREEFMKEVEYLLSDIPDEEKEDALAYYRDYLEEAGDGEAEVIREFGSPERIAAIIRADLRGDLEDGGVFTERGYEDERFRDPGYQVAKRQDLPEVHESGSGASADNAGGSREKAGQTGRENEQQRGGNGRGQKQNSGMPKGFKLILLILLLIAASPVLLGIGGGIVGVISGIAGLLLGAVCLFAGLTFSLLLAAVGVIVFGVVYAFNSLTGGIFCIGIGLIVLALGFLSLLASVWFYGKFLPWLARCTVDMGKRLFGRKEKTA